MLNLQIPMWPFKGGLQRHPHFPGAALSRVRLSPPARHRQRGLPAEPQWSALAGRWVLVLLGGHGDYFHLAFPQVLSIDEVMTIKQLVTVYEANQQENMKQDLSIDEKRN